MNTMPSLHRPRHGWVRYALVAPALLLLTACGGGSKGSGSGPVPVVTPPVAPAAPTSLQARAGDKQVTLSWAASTSATTYAVKRATATGGPYSPVGSIPGTGFLDLGLTDRTTYYYVVTALNGTSESAASAEAKATPVAALTPGAAPAAPTGLLATPGNAQVSLAWTGSTGATAYALKRATVSGGPYVQIASVTGTAFVDLTAANGTPYFYVVTALNGTAESAASAEAGATPQALPTAPAAPAVVLGDGQVTLSWAAIPGATSYQVARGPVSGGPYTPTGKPTTTPSFQDTGLTDGSPYYYVVTALNAVGTGLPSAEAAAIPVASPSGFTAIAGDKQVGLTWAGCLGATGYNVYEAATSGGTPTKLATTLSSRYLDANLPDGTPRYYRIAAVNATGEGVPTAFVAATPSAAATPLPPPEDSTRNLTGLGTWFLNDWDGSNAFVDAFASSRSWQAASDWHQPVAGVDANGWPTADASTVILTGTPAQTDGKYKLVFNGQATLGLMWCGGSIASQAYDATSNTTTADVTFAQSGSASMGLSFTNTQRTAGSAKGTGFTNARLYRPGYPADGSAIFTTPFLDAFRTANVKVVRMMDWDGGSSDIVQHWSDRTTPHSADQGGQPAPPYTAPDNSVYTSGKGVALEYRILLCNTLQADFWLNIPPVADQDFITRTAQTLRYGSDGTNPYTSPQANPVFPPLDPALKVYVEYSNETWNSAGGYSTFYIEEAICKALPANSPLLTPPTGNSWYTMWRWPAYNIAQISLAFRNVFGDAAMMTRIRPVLETQQGDGQDTLGQALTWLDSYAATLVPKRAVSDLIYGGGGSAYYGVIDATRADPDLFYAPTNYPDPQTLGAWATDTLWTYSYGVKHVAYEGGPGLAFSEGDNKLLNADPRMVAYMRTMHDAWSSMGGDLCTYYCVEGPSNWEFTSDINKTRSPKLQALAAINASPRAPLALGPALPGVIGTRDKTIPILSSGGFGETIGGVDTLSGLQTGNHLALPGHTAAPYTGTLTVHGYTRAANGIDVYVNGAKQGSVQLPVQTGNVVLNDSTSLPVTLPAGMNVIRLVVTGGNLSVANVTVK